MAAELSQQPDLGPVRQFSIFVENKVGRLNEMVESLAGADVHIMALCLVDTTDSTIIRIVVDYPERAEQILDEHRFAHDDVPVVAIELEFYLIDREAAAAGRIRPPAAPTASTP